MYRGRNFTMTTNEQCMKDILTFIDENTSVKVRTSSYNDIELRAPGISSILTALSKDNKYSIEEVAFNLVKCDKLHLIDANIYTQRNTIKSAQSDIYGITCYGEQFIKEN